MSFTDLLAWLTGADGGAFILVSWAVSWGLNGTAFWQKLSSQAKTLIILAVSGLLGAGAAALQSNPALVEAITPYFQPVIFIVMAWLGTQVAHRGTRSLEAKIEEAEASTITAKAETKQAKAQVEHVEVLVEAAQTQAAAPDDQ